MSESLGDRKRILAEPEYRYHFVKKARSDHESRGLFTNNPSPFTPEFIVEEMVSRLMNLHDIAGKKILVMFTLEMAIQLIAEGCNSKDITVATKKECGATKKIAEGFGCGYTALGDSNGEWRETAMKFNVVMGNPPYQNKGEGNRKSQTIWPDFVEKGHSLLEPEGVMAMIHPPGWRGIGKSFTNIKSILSQMDFLWLSIQDEKSGLNIFRRSTPFDMYIVRNSDSPNHVTTIRDIDGDESEICIKDMEIIPNADIEFVQSLIAKKDEKRVDVLYDPSFYRIGKKINQDYMVEKKSNKYSFPCVRYIFMHTGEIDCWYSDRDLGHFGVPKVMFGTMARAGEVTVDKHGDYGMTQFVAGIRDDVKNLDKICEAMNSDKFRKVMKSVRFTQQEFNRTVITRFRKDFWKEFV